MKHILLATCCALLFGVTQAQTLEETQLWIKDKIESHEYVKKGKNDWGWRITYHYEVSFTDDEKIWIRESIIEDDENRHVINHLYILPIKHIEGIKYIFEDDFVRVFFTIKGTLEYGLNLIVKNTYDEGWEKVLKTEKTSGTSIYINKSFLNEILPGRFKKAMNHLIELNGGEVVKEEF